MSICDLIKDELIAIDYAVVAAHGTRVVVSGAKLFGKRVSVGFGRDLDLC